MSLNVLIRTPLEELSFPLRTISRNHTLAYMSPSKKGGGTVHQHHTSDTKLLWNSSVFLRAHPLCVSPSAKGERARSWFVVAPSDTVSLLPEFV
jgi:hypothetical protein